MTTTPERTATLTTLVAAEIRAWMGRLDVRQSELARRMGETDQWMSMRLKGRTPIDLNELQRIADALGVSIVQLLPPAIRSGGSMPNERSSAIDHSADDKPTEPPVRHIATRPFGPIRRDPSRPVSAIPATRRRPGPVRPGNRMMPA